jgi:hypothetical protein
MSNILSFEFEELPLVFACGIPAAEINGCAEVAYDRSGYWEINSISVEGRQPLTQEQRDAGKRPWIYVTAPSSISDVVYDRLQEAYWRERIQEAVREQLASDREDAAEMRADMRRDEMMGL